MLLSLFWVMTCDEVGWLFLVIAGGFVVGVLMTRMIISCSVMRLVSSCILLLSKHVVVANSWHNCSIACSLHVTGVGCCDIISCNFLIAMTKQLVEVTDGSEK